MRFPFNKPKLLVVLTAITLAGCSKSLEVIPQNQPATLAATGAASTLEQLRNENVVSSTKYQSSDFGGGTWVLDTTDITTPDNTGTILVTKFGQRLKRVFSSAVNAIWFGLQNNSSSDQTLILQSAINASAGNTLQMPSGTFFTQQLSIVSNITIVGNNTKLRMIQGAYDNTMIKLSNISNVRITKMEIALNGINGNIYDGTSAMQLQNCSNIQIDNCFIHDNTFVGIRLIGGNNNIRINNNTIQNTDTGVHANNTNTNINIVKNIIENGTSEGITVYGYSAQNIPSNFLIDSNMIFYKQNSFGINIPYAHFGTITHNTIQNCLGGITLHDAVSTGNDNIYTSDMVIKNNVISNTGFGIIYVGDRTTVSNNVISSVQQDGINANNFDDPSVINTGVIISGNIITSPALAGGGRGGVSVKNLANSSITGNSISKCGSAFAIRYNGVCSNLQITANNCPDGTFQTTNTTFNESVTVEGNVFSSSYFPVSYPLGYKFMLVAPGNKYTSDTTYNNAPDNTGSFSGINTFTVRTKYFISNGTITNIVPSWTGRTIVLASTNSVALNQGSNIRLKNSKSTTIPQSKSLSLSFDGTYWNEVSRTF